MTRRHFLATGVAASLGLNGLTRNTAQAGTKAWFMPEEGSPHKGTWMAFGASAAIWGKKLLPDVQRNLALLANTIAQYEPVYMLVRQADLSTAQALVNDKVKLIVCPLDDLWIRDTGAIFVLNEAGEKAAIDFNFNGWGNKQSHANDAKVASFIAKQSQVPLMHTSLVMEGGCIEVDGEGTAIMTESCVINHNRNPNLSKAQIEDLLMPLLGLEKIIWLPGIKGKDITDGHTDFYARFVKPGVVLAGYDPDPKSYDHTVTQQHLEILKQAKDAKGNALSVTTLTSPQDIRPQFLNNEFAAGYIGFYLCNGAVIMQNFGDKAADLAAKTALQNAYPERKIEQINVDAIAAGGGTIHCATQQEPASFA